MNTMKVETLKYQTSNDQIGIIRPATLDEAKTIVPIENEAFSRLNTSLNKIKHQIKHPNKYVWLVAEQNNQIVGFQGIEWKNSLTFHLIRLGVWPKMRHQNIGQALFTAPEKIAKLNNVKYLIFEVRQSNTAQKMYFNCGYLVTGFKRFYYSHPREDAVLMTKTLK